MKKTVFIVTFLALFLLSLVIVQAVNFGAADSLGKVKTSFQNTEDVYAMSDSQVCTINKNISLYIVSDKQQWAQGDNLTDVRGGSQGVITSAEATLPLTKIWSKPKAGKYDVVLDCNNNGLYDADPFLEPLSASSATGFTVTAQAGTGLATIGKNTPVKTNVQYDPETPNTINEMLQFTLKADKEDIKVENITLSAFGDGNDLTGISNIELYLDKNDDGRKNILDEKLGEGSYEENDGVSLVLINYTLSSNTSANFLVIYTMNPEATGNFSLSLQSVYGLGTDSEKIIKFSGTPIFSSIKEFIQAKTCLGSLSIVYSPTPAQPQASVTAQLRNLTGCAEKIINLQNDICGLTAINICSCTSASDGCSCDFKAPSAKSAYYACIDKNSDNDYFDFGESASSSLDVVVPEVKPVQNETTPQQPPAQETSSSNISTTGEVIKLGEPQPTTGNFQTYYVILEVTLVLILIVLLFILVSLSKRGKPVETTQLQQQSPPAKPAKPAPKRTEE